MGGGLFKRSSWELVHEERTTDSEQLHLKPVKESQGEQGRWAQHKRYGTAEEPSNPEYGPQTDILCQKGSSTHSESAEPCTASLRPAPHTAIVTARGHQTMELKRNDSRDAGPKWEEVGESGWQFRWQRRIFFLQGHYFLLASHR